MRNYIVTVEETHFDATKFDFNKFYIVTEKSVEYRCLLKKVEKKVATFITVADGEDKRLYISPYEIKNGNATIEEVVTLDEVVPLSKAKIKTKYWDLYHKDAEMKVGKCYELKIGERVYKGFCSHKDSIDIIMVLYSDTGSIAAISYEFTTCGKWNDKIIYDSLTHGVVVRINRSELKEDRVYFKELV